MESISISDPVCERLRQISDPPKALFFLGNPALLALHSIAIVGSRHPSEYGGRAALSFAIELARRGMCIVSGLAQGIDAAAHRGALRVGGYTIAVLGSGLDRIYPATNRFLASQILEAGGCLVSEYPPGTPPFKAHFPARNRIISGLSWGTLVVQAARRSGSLITARLSGEQGREVFVLPGHYDDEGFWGSHWLIQQGAKLVTEPNHVMEELPPGLSSWLPVENVQSPLRAIFSMGGGARSLEELFDAGVGSAELEAGLREGSLMEVAPQRYAWAGFFETQVRTPRETSHPAACQMGNSSQQ